MAKKLVKTKKAAPRLPPKLNLPNDQPVSINMPFEDAIKHALNTPIPKGMKSAKKKKTQ